MIKILSTRNRRAHPQLDKWVTIKTLQLTSYLLMKNGMFSSYDEELGKDAHSYHPSIQHQWIRQCNKARKMNIGIYDGKEETKLSYCQAI